MRRVVRSLTLAVAIASGGCATTFQKSDGCDRVSDPAAPAGFAVYSCPHGFIVPSSDGRTSARYASGVTSCVDRTVFYYEGRPEIRAHEYRHAAACSTGGGQH